MPPEKQAQTTKQAKSASNKKKIDLEKLAEKIVALLLRELDIERERTGR